MRRKALKAIRKSSVLDGEKEPADESGCFGYKMPTYAHFGTADGLPPLPSAADVKRTADWMIGKGMIKAMPKLEEVVFVP